jgi:PAS domain S-box-containing protein
MLIAGSENILNMKDTTRQKAVNKKSPPARKNRSSKKTGGGAFPRHHSPERRRFEQLFYRLSTFFLAADSSQLEEKIEKGLTDVAAYFKTDRVTLWQFSSDGQEIIPTCSFVQQGVEPLKPIRLLQNRPQPEEKINTTDNPIDSVPNNPPTFADMGWLPLRMVDDKSFLAIPLLVANSLHGVFTLSHVGSEYFWQDQEIVQAHRLGEIFANVIDRKRYQQMLEKRIQFETLLSNISAQFANGSLYAIDYEIEYALEQLRVFFDVDRCTIGRFTEDGCKLILEYSMQTDEVKLTPEFVLEEELPWFFKQLRLGKPVAISRLTDFPAEAIRECQFCRDRGVKGFLSFPLMSGSRTLGSFVLMSTRGEKQWPEDLVERFHVITTLFANVLIRMQTDEAICASEEFNRSVLASLNYHIAILDRTGLILAVNEAWERFARDNGGPSYTNIGPGSNYIDACRVAEAHDDPFAQAAIDGIQSVQGGTQDMFSLEYPCHSPTEERWFIMRVLPLKGQADGVVISHSDISDLKKAEKELCKRDEVFSEAQRIAHVGSWEWQIASGGLVWSDEVYRIFGYPPQKFSPTYDAFLNAVHADDRDMVQQAVEKALAEPQTPYSIKHRLIRPDGMERFVHEQGEILCDTKGKPIRMLGTVLDITESKMAENALRQAYTEIKQLKDQMEAENVYLWKEIKQEHGFEEIVGESDAIKYMLYRIKQVAPTDATILIQGETGTGKGLVARALHKVSGRKQKPLVNINCAALPANLIESELFGREKGAFTGAQTRQIGRFELADGGTIFLDEIGELPIDLQAKLLKVIEDGEFERLGSPHSIKVNTRIIASTNRNLEEEIKKGRFRNDLYYRLHVFPITTPPLRQRKEDIPLLVEHFAQKYSKIMGKEISTISKSSIKRLYDYPWPGNVRELENIIERAVITSTGKTLTLSELHSSQRSGEYPQDPSHKRLADIERAHIIKTLKQAGWRIEGVSGAASILGLNPSTLRSRMKKMGIQRQSLN